MIIIQKVNKCGLWIFIQCHHGLHSLTPQNAIKPFKKSGLSNDLYKIQVGCFILLKNSLIWRLGDTKKSNMF